MRSIGDRALNRGQISREIMLENYQKIREKYKCKYMLALAAAILLRCPSQLR